jgi:hypothetical protein
VKREKRLKYIHIIKYITQYNKLYEIIDLERSSSKRYVKYVLRMEHILYPDLGTSCLHWFIPALHLSFFPEKKHVKGAA